MKQIWLLFLALLYWHFFCFLTEWQIVQVSCSITMFWMLLLNCNIWLLMSPVFIYLFICRNESTSYLDRNDALFSRSYGESRRPYSSRLDRDDTTDYKKVCSHFQLCIFILFKFGRQKSWKTRRYLHEKLKVQKLFWSPSHVRYRTFTSCCLKFF